MAIQLQQVSFGYPGGDLLFEDVSMRVGNAECVGVVGPNGVGKSTVYLRWPDKDSLLTAAVTSRGLELTTIDTGTLEGDLRQLSRNLLGHFHSAAGWAAIRVTMDCASVKEQLGELEILRDHAGKLTGGLHRAVGKAAKGIKS